MKCVSLVAIACMTTLLPLLTDAQTDPAIIAGKDVAVVATEYGKVRGYIHNGMYTFKGIPYGKAERFMPAQKPASWEGIRSSMSYGPVCPNNDTPSFNDEIEFSFQRSHAYYSNEDCLNLNIWTKGTGDVKKPVMVWLHGGGFSSGSSIEFPAYDGENLSRTGDVVVVSLNHRLNVLGFLDLSAYGEKYKYSGNVGAMDMVAALTWVKENISNFGGDPGNVTIFGQSGGGAKVTCLLNAPSAKGLFHKAIIQSGSYFNHFIERGVAKKLSAALLDELKLQAGAVASLTTMPWEQLEAASKKAIKKVQGTLTPEEMPAFGLEWEPFRDGDFIPYQPDEPAAIALSKDIPLMVGCVKNEYTPFAPDSKNLSMDDVQARLHKKYGAKTDAYIAAVKKAYPETVKPTDYLDIDFIFRPFVLKQADKKAHAGTAAVYVYLFAWQSPVLDGYFKAYHCMDLPFVFNNINRSEEMTGGGKDAHLLADKVSQAWARFALTGNPTHKGLPAWNPYTTENGATMIFDNTCEVKNHHDRELLVFGATK